MISLLSLNIGESAIIKEINVDDEIKKRLLDIGLVSNTIIKCVGESPFSDPKAYLIRGAVIAVRNNDAQKILVEKV